MKRIISSSVFLFLFCCAGFSIIEFKDDYGRINKRVFNKDGELESVEEIEYLDKTSLPQKKIYLKQVGTELIPFREETYLYRNDLLKKINFFIYEEGKKINSGKVAYSYYEKLPNKIEYSSIKDIKQKKMFFSGMDLYEYEGETLKNRRIIEYDYNEETKKTIQLSQYVILYDAGKIKSMQIWFLDKNTNNIIKKNEDNEKIIPEIIKNIEKLLLEKTKGIKFLKNKRREDG